MESKLFYKSQRMAIYLCYQKPKIQKLVIMLPRERDHVATKECTLFLKV